MVSMAVLLLAGTPARAGVPVPDADGANPAPVHLVRAPAAPLSAVAEVGRAIFFDKSLSVSGTMSCASCHDPAHAFAPTGTMAVMKGGAHGDLFGVRAVPSLMYLERQPNFSVGPDQGEAEGPPAQMLAQSIAASAGASRSTKIAGSSAATTNMVPQGGLFWDGRADTLQIQAMGPLTNRLEMANENADAVTERLKRAPYAQQLVQIFGPTVMKQPGLLAAEAMFAVARYQIEEPAFHPYSSKFDAWLEGRARFTPAEARGWRLFNDSARANCAGCHVDQVQDNRPPVFTDHQFEALGAPRNPDILFNRDPAYFDLGVCGPIRTDMRDQKQYCGMFLTPTLRNVATRSVFFHNGVFHSLRQVMDFYNYRDVAPARAFPHAPDGKPVGSNDIPAAYRANIDVQDPPFDRHPGDLPAMSDQDEADIITFLGTLTDGYKPASRTP